LEILGGIPGNLPALPNDIFEVCTPTKGSHEIIRAPSSKWLALDFISAASVDSIGVSIDEHPLWVYAADGQFIQPVKVDALNLMNGDRYSVFVELNKPASQYGIRIVSTAGVLLMNSMAILAYPGVIGGDINSIKSAPTIDPVGALISPGTTSYLDPLKAAPFPPRFPQPAPAADQTVIMSLGIVGRSYQWAVNGTTLDHAVVDNLSPPLLYQDPLSAHFGENVTIITKNNTWVDLVFKIESFPQPAHPMHKHSNKAYLIGQGDGSFTWKTVAEAAKAIPGNFNFVNPPFRDGFTTPPANTGPSWMAVRYHVENPGAFMIHCHIQSHLEGGMAMVMLDGVDEWPAVPKQYKN
jgi:FtsP/CotA-like multicopper oxidase with cupredoxin domain